MEAMHAAAFDASSRQDAPFTEGVHAADGAGGSGEEVPRTETGLRILYSLVLYVLLHVVVGLLTLLVAFQLVYALVTRRAPHARVGKLGRSLVDYCHSAFRYLVHQSDRPPFPFDDLEEPAAADEAPGATA